MEDGIEIQKVPPFPSRGLVIAAANMLKADGHSGFDALRLEWDLIDTNAGEGSGLAARATSLAAYALKDPELRTPDGRMSLQSAIVVKAGEIYREGYTTNIGNKEREAFKKFSNEAGSKNDVSETGIIFANSVGDFDTRSDVSPLVDRTSAIDIQIRKASPVKSNKVFIVHGHDGEARESVARYLERIGFEPIILHEQANRSRTIIEKIEANRDVSFAVILLTPDDEGCVKGGTPEPRVRQNVLLELGYFMAHLGRENICALKRGHVEVPSDFAGVVWEAMDENGGWKSNLARELQAAGHSIDWNKVMTK